MAQAVERFKNRLLGDGQKSGQRLRGQGVARRIEKICLALLAPEKGEFPAILRLQAAAHQQLVVGMEKIVVGSFRKTEEPGLERPEGAALPGLVGAVHDVQARPQLQGAIGESTEGLEFESGNPHRLSPCPSSLAMSISLTSSPRELVHSGEVATTPDSCRSSGGNLLCSTPISGTSSRRVFD